jgi:signal-transduction protein with cAMP-binding, CBS, and nucleotidyltransferase domain
MWWSLLNDTVPSEMEERATKTSVSFSRRFKKSGVNTLSKDISNKLTEWICKHRIPKIGDVMSKIAASVDENTSMMDVARSISNRSGETILVTREGVNVGILTHRDMIKKVLARNLSANETKVGDIMSSPIICIGENETVATVAELMLKENSEGVVVIDSDSKPIGTLSEIELEDLGECDLSYVLALKKYVADTSAQFMFFGTLSVILDVFIVGIAVNQWIASNILGTISTLGLGGVFGTFLDRWRQKLGVSK